MSDLAELLARVEAATGPDRELDAQIVCAANGWTFERFSTPTDRPRMTGCFIYVRSNGVRVWSQAEDNACVTASLDRALALVERVRPGWWREFTEHDNGGPRRWLVTLTAPRGTPGVGEAEASTPALALLAALLKSLLASPATTSCEGE
jgi:hypothetical protein